MNWIESYTAGRKQQWPVPTPKQIKRVRDGTQMQFAMNYSLNADTPEEQDMEMRVRRGISPGAFFVD